MNPQNSTVCTPLPKILLILSGKRKSGKDFVAARIQQRLGNEVCDLLRLSEPLKAQYAKDHKLDYEHLLDASDYKERYRVDMIKWGEQVRREDPAYFCRLATHRREGRSAEVWVICDARRMTDIDYFRTAFRERLITVRIVADQTVRESRGYVFTHGVDDAESECDLDHYQDWDFVVHNDTDTLSLDKQLQPLLDEIARRRS